MFHVINYKNMLRHIIFWIFLIALHLQCGAQEITSNFSHNNTLVVRLTCNDSLNISNMQGIPYEIGLDGHPTYEWAEFSGDSLTLPLDMIEEMSIIKGKEVLRSQFTLGDSIGILGEASQKWFVDSIFPEKWSVRTKEYKKFNLYNYKRWIVYDSKNGVFKWKFSPCYMVFMDDPDDTNGLKSWGEFQGYNYECAWGAVHPEDTVCCKKVTYHSDILNRNSWYWTYAYNDIGNDIGHTQYDYFANIAVEQARQHGVEISYADSPIWMASKEDVEYLLKNCGRDIMRERNEENIWHSGPVKNLSERNCYTYLRLYNANDYCLYIASDEMRRYKNSYNINSELSTYDTMGDYISDPISSITTVSPRTLRDCQQSSKGLTENENQRPARYACLWTSTLAPEGDDNTKAWALQITPEGCCLIKMDRSTKLPALMVGRPIDPNVISTRKNINLKY